MKIHDLNGNSVSDMEIADLKWRFCILYGFSGSDMEIPDQWMEILD